MIYEKWESKVEKMAKTNFFEDVFDRNRFKMVLSVFQIENLDFENFYLMNFLGGPILFFQINGSNSSNHPLEAKDLTRP